MSEVKNFFLHFMGLHTFRKVAVAVIYVFLKKNPVYRTF